MSIKKTRHLPGALLGEIVGYLDIIHDVFFPHLHKKWERETRIEEIEFEGGKKIKVNGQVHSWHDRPAIVHTGRVEKWYWRGRLHRQGDQPAYVRKSKGKIEYRAWYRNGRLHRAHGRPAVICDKDKKQEWWIRGKFCRNNNQPVVEYNRGRKMWANIQGELHRDDDLPAIENETNNCRE